MVHSIIIIGEVPAQDYQLITAGAQKHALSVQVVDTSVGLTEELRARSNAYISYLPCNKLSFLDLIATLPLGAGEHFPFFIAQSSGVLPDFLQEFPVSGIFQPPLTSIAVENIFRTITFFKKIAKNSATYIEEVQKYRKQKYQLIKLSTALSSHYDLSALLELILKESLDILNADAGSVYVRERSGPGKNFTDKLRFKVSKNFSVQFEPGKEFTIDIDKNRIAGYVAYTGEILNIPDVYALDDAVPYKFSKDFDERFRYRMKSMLTVPLKNVEGEVVGVLQVMNKKNKHGVVLSSPAIVSDMVTEFTYLDEEFMRSIGALAAVSIERTQLYENIEQIFEGFLDASIASIDERDRVTSGHSRRVMGYAMRFVDALNKTRDIRFQNEVFTNERKRQFKFAALLHDIGKIGVPERLLTKETRLDAGRIEVVLLRLEYIKFLFMTHEPVIAGQWLSTEEIDAAGLFLERLNKAGMLNQEDLDRLQAICRKGWKRNDGVLLPLITDEEYQALSVARGNLTAQERETINSHATASYRILSNIPWVPAMEKIPAIAAHHHEMLNGTGYPDGLKAPDIPLEVRILTVVDIYDALVAQDRPYKPAMRSSKALGILQADVQSGRLDKDVVAFFIEQEIYALFNSEHKASA